MSGAPGLGLGARGRIAIKLLAAIFVTELLLRVAFTVYAVRLEPGCGWERLSLIRLVVAYRVHFGWEGDVEFASPPFVLDPRRGYKLAPDVRGVLHNGTVVNSNSLGARGRREYMLPKPSGRPRFLALGDSLTFGEGVADDETWPALLEASADVEVVNLGAPAYAHDQMYFALVDDGLGLQPDRGILGFHPGDMIRNLFTFYCWEKPCWRREGGEWRLLNVPNSGADQYRDRLFVPLLWALPRALLEPPDLGDIDADPEGEAVTWELAAGPDGAQLVDGPPPSLGWTPAAAGREWFDLRARDPAGNQAPQRFTVVAWARSSAFCCRFVRKALAWLRKALAMLVPNRSA